MAQFYIWYVGLMKFIFRIPNYEATVGSVGHIFFYNNFLTQFY